MDFTTTGLVFLVIGVIVVIARNWERQLFSGRFHLVEIHELSFIPTFYHSFCVEVLLGAWNPPFRIPGTIKDPYEAVGEVLAPVMKKVNATHILDTCSGGGGPWYALQKQLAKELDTEVTVTLSDLYPHPEEWQERVEKFDSPGVSYISESVDVTRCEKKADIITMFNSFHHMQPDVAADILGDAVRSKTPIAVFELAKRDLNHAMVIGLFAILGPIATLVDNFSWKRLLVLPIVLMTMVNDGIVSVLRMYSREEFYAVAKEADPYDEFEWVHGETMMIPHFLGMGYFIGYPKSAVDSPQIEG
jgi:hypothetical protein